MAPGGHIFGGAECEFIAQASYFWKSNEGNTVFSCASTAGMVTQMHSCPIVTLTLKQCSHRRHLHIYCIYLYMCLTPKNKGESNQSSSNSLSWLSIPIARNSDPRRHQSTGMDEKTACRTSILQLFHCRTSTRTAAAVPTNFNDKQPISSLSLFLEYLLVHAGYRPGIVVRCGVYFMGCVDCTCFLHNPEGAVLTTRAGLPLFVQRDPPPVGGPEVLFRRKF